MASVGEADVLVMQVMREPWLSGRRLRPACRGRPVDHPDVVSNYRSGHDVAERSRTGECDTEELRQAVVHYRALFAVLLEDGDGAARRDPADGERNEGGARLVN